MKSKRSKVVDLVKVKDYAGTLRIVRKFPTILTEDQKKNISNS